MLCKNCMLGVIKHLEKENVRAVEIMEPEIMVAQFMDEVHYFVFHSLWRVTGWTCQANLSVI